MNHTCNASWLNISSNSSNWLNQNVSAYLSACSEFGAQIPPPINPFEDFNKAAFGSSIFMFVVSFITVLANGLLLLIFCVDPLKIFRNPTTYFLIGLAIVDLLTGLVQEPIYATCFIFLYLQHPSMAKCQSYMQFAYYFATFSITVSLIIVFAFTVTQYIVVASPLKYGRLVTKKKVLISVVLIYVYSAIFSCLPLMGVSEKVHEAITLFLHSYAVVLVTIVFYILLHYTMKKKMASGNSLRNESTSREESKHAQVQRNFVRLNVILLIVLIVCFVPTMIMMTIRLYMEEHLAPYWPNVLMANLMTDNLHYLKFLLDPFVYAWRMPKYRESLSKVVCRKSIGKESNRNGNKSMSTGAISVSELTTTEMNKSTITLLSFKNVPTD
ncbi:melanopsin-B-like [Oculina patagonica]